MQINTLQLPVGWEKVELHKLANRVGKRWVDGNKLPDDLPGYGTVCQDCGRRATHCPDFKICQSQIEMRNRYGFYGPNNMIYLGFIKRIVFFMLFCVILYSVPMFVLDLVGVVCNQDSKNCNTQNIIYYWSIYNVLGSNPGSLPHHIIWFVFSISMIVFTLYLRKYSMNLYRYINNRNQTDSDFCLIIRGLPKQAQQQQIINLLECQTVILYQQREQKSQKVLQQLKKIKVKDIMMIYKFHQLMQVNNKNVKQFKKFMKGKPAQQAKQFIPQKLPQVTQFANAAIVRFYDNQTATLIAKTVQVNFAYKAINYFFPFYHPPTQYQVLGTKVSMQTAPDPTDIQWQNFGFSQILRVGRKVLCSLFVIVLLIVSAAFSITISIWIQSLLSNTGTQPVFLTIVLVVITLVYNTIIQVIISFAIKLIYLDTFTDQYCQQMSITVVSQAINLGFFSIFAPIIAKLPSFVKLNTSDSSSFPLVMFTTMIIQSFIGTGVGFLLQYFQVVQRVMKLLNNLGIIINTQTQAFKTFKGAQVPIVNSYSHNVIIVWFSFLYGVVSPICVAIGLVGMILYYFYQRILFNSRYSIPVYGGPRINASMIDLLDFLPFLIGLFNLFVYNTSLNQRGFQADSRVYGIVITNIAIGVFHALFPWRPVIQKIFQQNVITIYAEFDRSKLQKTYEKCYPASKPGFEILAKPLVQLAQGEGGQRKKINISQYLGEVQKQSFEQIVESAKKYCCSPW